MRSATSRLFRPEFIIPAKASTLVPVRGADLVDLRSLGFMPGVAGGSRGFNQHGDIVYQTADGVNINDLWAEFQATISLQNAPRDNLVSLLTYNVNNPIEEVIQGGTTVDFELASEYGEPVGYRPDVPVAFNMGYTFKWYDLAQRFTWQYLADAPASQVQALNAMALEADNRLVFTEVMRSIFRPTNRNANIQGQPYSVYTFYNADGTVPPAYKSYTHDGTHTHFLVSGAASVDSGDIDAMLTHLQHHGFSQANGNRILLLVNKQEGDIIRNFRSVVNGGTATYDFIAARGTTPFLLPTDPTTGAILQLPQGVTAPAASFNGLDVIGSYGDALVVQEDYMPPGYMFMFATGGQAGLTNPIGFRQHANTSLRGLQLVKGRNADYPLQDAFYLRGFGTGIRQRGGGVVMQVKASGSYAAPTLYA